MSRPTTLFDKIWERHEVAPGLIYIDLHLVHEVTSPQAFDGLRLAGRKVRRPDRTLATADHNVPTDGTMSAQRIKDQLSRVQVETLEANCAEFGVPLFSLGSEHQGIVHVIGPELGVTQPGMTIVCGDSHTATHGAFGALAFGIGTSEVEHVLATQCLVQRKPRSMRIDYVGSMGNGVTAKDLILATIGQMGVAGATGHVVEFSGDVIRGLSMEGRMTICNMTIEGGGRAGMIAPDDTTFAWVSEHGGTVQENWGELHTEDGASFDREITVDVDAISPQVTWGTNPEMVVGGRRRGAGAAGRRRRARAALHGAAAGDADRWRSSSTACSSARARTRGSATCARRRHVVQGPQGRVARQRDGRPRLGAGEGAGRGRRASTRSSAPPASTGAARAARCAWA